MTDTIVHSARLVQSGTETPDAWIAMVSGRIDAVGTGASWSDHPAARDGEVVDAAGRPLVPGFVDLHVHGGGGAAIDEGADAIATTRSVHRRHGTTRSVVSLVTAPLDALEARLRTIARVADGDPSVLGAHLEGPFLSPANRGAHDGDALIEPSPAAVERLLDAAGGHLVQVTIAPELPGAEEAVRAFVAAGVTVAVGHTTTDAGGARTAFSAGATLLTHAFNAMPGIHHRDPGPIVAAVGDPSVVLELIADGVHVDPAVLALAFTAAPGRIALVTDAMAAAGAHDGSYELGGLAVTVTDGVARLTDSGVIAGSTATLDLALRTVVAAGVPLAEAVRALTETPARVIGRGDAFGEIAVGRVADAVLLEDDLGIAAVWADGIRAV